jgi:hypothetical protein
VTLAGGLVAWTWSSIHVLVVWAGSSGAEFSPAARPGMSFV